MGNPKLIVLLMTTAMAFAQSRAFHLDNPPTPQGYQELLTVLRTVNAIRDVSDNPAAQSVTVAGTQEQIVGSEWLVQRLDHRADDPQIQGSAIYQYVVPGAADDVMRVFYLKNTDTPQGIQELLTTLRTVADVQKVFNYTPLKAIAMRGPSAQVAMAAWLVQQLDIPSTDRTIPDTGAHEFLSPAKADDVTRVFYLRNAQPGTLNEALTAVRSKGRIQKAFINTPTRSVIVRGTADQIAVAERLIGNASPVTP